MWVKIAALLISIGVSILAGETCLRLVFDPVDYLKPDTQPHPVLGRVITPDSGGHDELGFRNPELPDSIDVVTIGDSMTYGYAASMSESWPSWYGRLSSRSVYNLGIGGYGPAEYVHLLETRALSLAPELIVVAFYFGNDLHNAYLSVETRDHWRELREDTGVPPSGSRDEAERRASSPPRALHRRDNVARAWLRSHSMIFRLVETSPLGELVNALGDRRSKREDGGCQLALTEPFATIMKLDDRFPGIDLDRPEVRRGLQLSLRFVDEMIDLTRRHEIDLAVLLLPSKERVLAPWASPVSPTCRLVLDSFIESELEASAAIRALLDQRGIPVIDPLGELSAGAREGRIYPRSGDTHPNGRGYRLIAEEVARVLSSSAPR